MRLTDDGLGGLQAHPKAKSRREAAVGPPERDWDSDPRGEQPRGIIDSFASEEKSQPRPYKALARCVRWGPPDPRRDLAGADPPRASRPHLRHARNKLCLRTRLFPAVSRGFLGPGGPMAATGAAPVRHTFACVGEQTPAGFGVASQPRTQHGPTRANCGDAVGCAVAAIQRWGKPRASSHRAVTTCWSVPALCRRAHRRRMADSRTAI